MKKILMLGAAAFFMGAPLAHAEDAAKSAPDAAPAQGHHGGKTLEQADTDGDGNVSKQEFLAFHEKRFAEMDTNSDGNISKEEIEARRKQWQDKIKEMRSRRGSSGKPPEAPAENPAQ